MSQRGNSCLCIASFFSFARILSAAEITTSIEGLVTKVDHSAKTVVVTAAIDSSSFICRDFTHGE
jgi:hypothetical protein